MRHSCWFFFFLTLNLLNASCSDLLRSDDLAECISRKEVQNVAAVEECIIESGKGLFCFDADEVLFTYRVRAEMAEAELIPLVEDLDGLIRRIQDSGHKAIIITYNHAEVISRKLDQVGIQRDIAEIIACEMKGDFTTAKGALLEAYVERIGISFDFWVFIDNFLPFVEDIERVAARRDIRLFSFVCSGYLKYYPAYVYWYLTRLQQESTDSSDDKATRIMPSLRKYKINLRQFKENYPTLKKFIDKTKGLSWPYLVYL